MNAILVVFAIAALSLWGSHAYAHRQAYKTGVYIGKSAFSAAAYRNRRCLSLRADGGQPACEIADLRDASVMEHALASANLIPSRSESDRTAIHDGFRDGWRAGTTADAANR